MSTSGDAARQVADTAATLARIKTAVVEVIKTAPRWEISDYNLFDRDLGLHAIVSAGYYPKEGWWWVDVYDSTEATPTEVFGRRCFPTLEEAQAAVEVFFARWCTDCHVSQGQVVDWVGMDGHCGMCGAEL